MEYVKFGRTGLDVSRICLGCMTYGAPERGNHPWTLTEESSRPLIRQALECGINFFDTANSYSVGSSEEIVGRALKDFARRDEIVVATKVYHGMRDGRNARGLSRKAIMAEVDHSLRRLGMDYIDLYQTHRYDHLTPIEETMEALHDVVKAGKVRYIGASSMRTWQLAKAVYTARQNGWTSFVSIQDHLNLLYRENEREMLPFCTDEKIAFLPWSPLARGRLTRAWNETSERQDTDAFGKTLYEAALHSDQQVVDCVGQVATARGVARAQIALAWILQKGAVTAPIIGASKATHIEDAVASLSLKLTAEEVTQLESAYIPHAVVGIQ
jgi:1-deoxyxylulose-5-phosphate synthase